MVKVYLLADPKSKNMLHTFESLIKSAEATPHVLILATGMHDAPMTTQRVSSSSTTTNHAGKYYLPRNLAYNSRPL